MEINNKSSQPIDFVALQQVLDLVEQLIGKEHVTCNTSTLSLALEPQRNVSQFRSRVIYAVIRPHCVEQVQEITRLFNRFKTHVGLHIISSGRNWGLGSAQPATDGVVVMALGYLKAQRTINCASGWAVIEPGVTQLELSQALLGTERMLNVTASSGHTSVIGNALDRGVGLQRQRTDDIAGLEVILPNGELIRVGWWPDTIKNTAVNPQGLGPALLPLFMQSNLGIVTAAVVKLLPRPEAQCVLRLSFPQENLHQAIAVLRRWVAQGLVSGVLKIYDAISTESYGGDPGQHLVLICVSGTERRTEAITQVLLEEIAESQLFAKVTRSDTAAAAANDFVLQVVEHAYAGDPSYNELMLKSAVGQDAEQVDSAGGGWLFFLPLIPFNSDAIVKAFSLIDTIYEKTGIRAGSTVNALSADLIDLVISLRFQPNQAQIKQAHQALEMAYQLFTEAGFYPYRLDIDHGHWKSRLEQDHSTHQLVLNIKQLLDPNSIIASGRYA
ncbi:4-cresol dehydrogenase (hydroxylating) [Serratia fonticola]|uniref:4-cresol dehydrogenase (Hydroxylating) n=1 Tax=Serratia fonticola TaxID=47917 RepID=A0A559T9B1_SERFO|nr:4-cresol dehydrogenase (hydroxylating) [Serratia fonticola]TQI96710.1 4-cresol dehydrogenase (hydroxylating) [Serratia fonticola]TVZ71206.1 4-cresol dehydrogenase (hydroxylating) [Serratia fonticola]